MDAEGGLAGNTEDDEDHVMSTDREVPTHEVNDNYLNASVVLPRGNIYDRGKSIREKRDSDGNAIGRANDNPILDTRDFFLV